MSLTKRPYKGTRDFFPKEKRIQDYIFNIMKSVAHSFAYEHYDGPLLEEVELYKAKSGEELINEQIYSFYDRGERFVAIRPEMTPTLARMVAQIHKEEPRPIRWFSIPNLYRYEKPQRGRLREHWQLNCDIFGAPNGEGEFEIIQMLITLLTKFGANNKHFSICINDRKIVDKVFEHILKVSGELSYKLYKIIDKSKKVSSVALDKMIDETALSTEQKNLFKKYIQSSTIEKMNSFLSENSQVDALDDLNKLFNDAKNLNINQFLTYDPTIVRGLDYYTGIVFEVFDLNPQNPRAICGGGSYSDLLKIFGEKPLPGIGFGMGDVTLTDFLKTHDLLPDLSTPKNDLFISFQHDDCRIFSFKLAHELRKADLRVVSNFSALKFKKVFPLAEKKGAHFVAFMDELELRDQSVQIKNTQTKEQKSFKLNDIESIVSYILQK
ncbi:MAG: histidine--tRNA ligase [Halobacteriovoraceae bacterium]|nr:histidine--tRNA ligase [Halobacteriovoraceae bacterium]